MNGRLIGCATGALVVHGALLFGLHLDSNAQALAMSDVQSVDVSLVAEAPPDAEPPPEPEQPPAPEPEPPPPPEPTPPQDQPPPPPEPMAEPSAPPVEQRPPPPARPPARAERPAHPAPKTGAARAPAPSASASPGAKVETGVTAQAHYRSNPRPPYPPEARRLHEEGTVVLSVWVSAEGRATEVSVARSSGFPLLDEAAVGAVRGWTFDPATTLGLPMASRASVPMRFRLPAP